MRLKKIIIANLLVLLIFPVCAQKIASASDSTAISIKIEELKRTKNLLEHQIKIEDAKRNQSIPGVAPRTQERLNDKQDSVCLEIRSKLLSVNLELLELVPDNTSEIIANKLDEMIRNHENK